MLEIGQIPKEGAGRWTGGLTLLLCLFCNWRSQWTERKFQPALCRLLLICQNVNPLGERVAGNNSAANITVYLELTGSILGPDQSFGCHKQA